MQSPGSTFAALHNFKFLQNFIHSSTDGVDVLYTKYYNTMYDAKILLALSSVTA